jgi:hypothetical protein
MFKHDNTGLIKREAGRNARQIAFVDANVAPIAVFQKENFVVGQKAYGISGSKGFKVTQCDHEGFSIEVEGMSLWARQEEFKSKPWTAEEKEIYFNFRCQESERMEKETKNALTVFNEREKLARQFCR